MAGVVPASPPQPLQPSSAIRGQFAAIARLRWQLFQNGMRTMRGRLEVVSRIFMGIGFFVLGLGGASGICAGTWYFVSHGSPEAVAIFFWVIFLYWQLFPVMAQALAENIDSSHLLRYPLTYRAYFLIRIAYGSFEPATAIGMLWLVGMAAGLALASFSTFLWALPVLVLFAAFNILLARTIFSWIERWLARRKTREILGFVFFAFIIAVQFIGPAVQHFGRHHDSRIVATAGEALPFERILPPGIAATYIKSVATSDASAAAGTFALLSAFTLACFGLLHLRLRAYYRGEDLSESVARVATPVRTESVRAGWNVPFASSATSAIFQKELRYILRSGPMLFTLVMPFVILVIFRVTAGQGARSGSRFLSTSSQLAFPVGAAYSLLILTNLVYNSFGTEQSGVQFYFLSPARFREILLGKNLTHSTVLALDLMLVFVGSCLLYQPPEPRMFIATMCAVLFGLFVNLTVGNLLSLYSPKKVDFGTLGRQRASTITSFASLGVQAVTIGICVGTIFVARNFFQLWMAIPVLLVLAAFAAAGYALVLGRVDAIAMRQRETLISELSRA